VLLSNVYVFDSSCRARIIAFSKKGNPWCELCENIFFLTASRKFTMMAVM